ncbi:MAG: molybdopterin cofactor-binding domain-containing protein [Hymenobacter sp.]
MAKGRITRLDTAAARAVAGVVAIITHENAPKLPRPVMDSRGAVASPLPVLQDPQVHWNGEPIALVVADTQEAAEHAAALIRAEYAPQEAQTSFAEGKSRAELPADKLILMKPSEAVVGDAEAELRKAAHRVDNLYTTPRYNHNALEPHSTTAVFEEDGRLLVFDSTQNGPGVKFSLAQMFGLKDEQVQVIYLFVGGGFGSKGFMWLNTPLCVLAARQTGRPVKLALSRAGVYRAVGGRTSSEQRVAIGADADGHFRALIHAG